MNFRRLSLLLVPTRTPAPEFLILKVWGCSLRIQITTTLARDAAAAGSRESNSEKFWLRERRSKKEK